MLREELVPTDWFPWLPDLDQPMLGFQFSSFSTTQPRDDSSDWWLNRQIPGYSLRWKDLNRSQWHQIYELHPNLFFCPWIPFDRLIYWQENLAETVSMHLQG